MPADPSRRDALQVLAALLAGSAGAGWMTSVAAQVWPQRPVTFFQGFGPGGNPDLIARALAPALGERLGQPVVVEARVGAGGRLSTAHVARQPPDGHTWAMITGGDGVLAALAGNLQYDLMRDLAFVSTVAEFAFFFLVHDQSPYRTLADFVADAKKRPGQLNYGSGGIGTTLHLAMEYYKSIAGIELQHIPFKGAPIPELMAGRLDIAVTTPSSSAQVIRSGKARILGVTSPGRSPHFPEAPAIAETTPGFEVVSWLGVAVPAATPAAIVERLSGEINAALARDDVKTRLAAMGVDPAGSSPAQFRARVESDLRKWRSLSDRVKIGD